MNSSFIFLPLIKLYLIECGHVMYPHFRKCVQIGSIKLEWWRIFPVYIKYSSVWLQWQQLVQRGSRERHLFCRDHICLHYFLWLFWVVQVGKLLKVTTNHVMHPYLYFSCQWENFACPAFLLFCDVLTINVFVVQDCPSVPIGRSPRTDVLLKVENVVLEAGGCVLRLAGLYISSTNA